MDSGKSLIATKQGATLLEALIVLAIAALIAMASLPALGGIRTAGALRSECGGLKNAIERTLIRSAADNRDLYLKSGRDHYSVTERSGAEIEAHSYRPPIRGATNQIRVSFYAGRVVSPASIVLTNGSRRCRVVISLRGRTRIEWP